MPLGKPLLDLLDRMGHGGLLLDVNGHVSALNPTARRLLCEHFPESGAPSWARQALQSLLKLELSERFTMEQETWVAVPRPGQRHLMLHAVPLQQFNGFGPHTVLTLIDLDGAPKHNIEAIQKIFGVTPAEARIAVEIACGLSVDEIAQASGVAANTVRKQLASVFSKTRTHRQTELACLLARVAILP